MWITAPASNMPDSSLPPLESPAPGQRSSRSIAIPFKRTSSSRPMTSCGCRCGGCTCSTCPSHGSITMPDSNREIYGGQGTSVDNLSHAFASLHASSSLTAPAPKNIIVVPPSVELLSKLNEQTPAQLAEARTEQFLEELLDDDPWAHFVSQRSMTSDASEMSGMLWPMELEDSMENNVVYSSSRSMRSSYMSAMTGHSETASAVVKHAGEGLAVLRHLRGNERH